MAGFIVGLVTALGALAVLGLAPRTAEADGRHRAGLDRPVHAPSTAEADVCGDTAGIVLGSTAPYKISCRCGDTVTTDTRLDDRDPILSMVCPAAGLEVASGVSLEITGTIRGSGESCGIMAGYHGPAAGITVTGGRIVGFKHGVCFSEVVGGEISDLVVRRNTHFGVLANAVQDVTVSRVVAQRNGYGGIYVEALAGVTIADNLAERNKRAGLLVMTEDGGDYVGPLVVRNVARRNGGDGILLVKDRGGEALVFSRNRSTGNGGYGIRQHLNVDAEPATTFTDNICSGATPAADNARGPSSPPGLCE